LSVSWWSKKYVQYSDCNAFLSERYRTICSNKKQKSLGGRSGSIAQFRDVVWSVRLCAGVGYFKSNDQTGICWRCVAEAHENIAKSDLYLLCFSQRSFPLARTRDEAQAPIRMEHEQRVIIKFLFNDGLNTRQIVKKLEAQFHEDAYSLHTVQFCIGEV
jgi:hypothetical protein